MQLKKIRILHLIKSLDIGGIEKSTILYSNLLVSKVDFIGIYSSTGDFDISKLLHHNVKRFLPPYLISKNFFFFNNLANLLHVINKNKISHIHYHHRIYIPFVFFIKIFFTKIKIIYTHHSLFNDKINYLIISNKIIALNEATKNDLPKYLWKKTEIIPHGVHIQNTFIKQLATSNNIGYVGRFVKSKGLVKLIRAFYIVNNKYNNSKLLFVGDGPLKKNMIDEINKLGITNNVVFKKILLKEQDIYSDIDLLILPSEKLEGFGLVILEAMRNGIPVVVSKLNSFKELIIDEHTGIIFNDDLAEKIIFYLENKIKLHEIRKKAFQHLEENYNIEMVIKKYLDVIYT